MILSIWMILTLFIFSFLWLRERPKEHYLSEYIVNFVASLFIAGVILAVILGAISVFV